MSCCTHSAWRSIAAGLAIIGVIASTAAVRADDDAKIVTLQIRERAIAKNNRTVRVDLGDKVTLRWTTDEATELHLHGYDISLALLPGRPAEMRFTAHAAGRFPISAHGFGVPTPGAPLEEKILLYLEVYPR